MTETEQVVTEVRNEAQQLINRIYDVKKRLAVSGIKPNKWFNHGIADLETGLHQVERAFLATPKRGRKEQGQSQSQSQTYRSGNS